MDYPPRMEQKVQSLIIALSLRFAKRKPGLEIDDLINEALIVYSRIKELYDPTRGASLITIVYESITNQFINLTKKYLVSPHQDIDEEYNIAGALFPPEVLEERIKHVKENLADSLAKEVLEKLTGTTKRKSTIKEICKELNISFFRYQQAEFKIKQAIEKAARKSQ